MEKVALILLSTLILSGCSSYGMQGNPAAVQAGAATEKQGYHRPFERE